MADRYSVSSKSSISAALVHWDAVREHWHWDRVIQSGDPLRGGKLTTFVLRLMARTPFYPSSTIGNYVWALCAFMEESLQLDPRVGTIGWTFFMASVKVMCFVPTEPRARLPTSVIRAALGQVDKTSFAQVQMAVFVLLLYFTFQRSEFPCPKTYGGLDAAKHCLVRHMQPWEGGTRWAVGTTKADPKAERLSGDAGPGREWIVIGEVGDELFDMRGWLALFYQFFPKGPRDPDGPFFVAEDLVRPLIYDRAVRNFRTFITGCCDDPSVYALHSVRVEGWNTCSHAVSEMAATIQGGWASPASGSRYERLTIELAQSIPRRMIAHHDPSAQNAEDLDDSGEPLASMTLSSGKDLGIVSARAAAPKTAPTRKGRKAALVAQGEARVTYQPVGLPTGWKRVWHPTANSRRGGYATFEGPGGMKARSPLEAAKKAARPKAALASVTVAHAPFVPQAPQRPTITVKNLTDHVTYFDRPPAPRR